jgi:gamma-carbonic anhydrase
VPVLPYEGRLPRLGARVFLAPGAYVTGDVEAGDDVSFWFHTVARGDVNWIRVGAGTNVQDGSVLHVAHERFPLRIGERVVIGHHAVVHGCTVEDGALIGIGARVLDGAVVERGAQVGAGAVVAPGHRVPAGHLALGVPARVVRPLTDDEARRIADTADRYIAVKDRYRALLGDGTAALGIG